jgi:plastocyanin
VALRHVVSPRPAVPLRRPLILAVLCACLAGALAAPAMATTTGPGVQHLHYRFGPLHIAPGQNTINIKPNFQRPKVPGYITAFRPNLQYTDGTIPRVDVIHLHHGVWLINGAPTFAAGEEKTAVNLPAGFGFRYTPDQMWLMNYMIHNLTPSPDTVYITYDIDFVPDTSPVAATMTGVHTQWMDVAGIKAYPVFDALRGSGHNGTFTFPDDAPHSPDIGPAHTWTITRPTTLVQAAGHLHPGGKQVWLDATRNGQTVRLFTSKAHYYEPAGAVSWDVAMSTTPADWRVLLQPGDVVTVHGSYDVRKASWYESMAIMPTAVQDGVGTSGYDPFTQHDRIPQVGPLTHGHLAENDNHGGGPAGLPNPAKQLDGPVAKTQVTIDGFVYGQGDLSMTGLPGRPPVVRQGGTLKFLNADSADTIWHTITACRAPCNKATGIAYPLADGPVTFDSGELGYGPAGATAAANRDTWTTPKSLKVGTYTYFCRIHPFMRGSFRVIPAAGRKRAPAQRGTGRS